MTLDNQTVLVTGATGFTGGALARRLAAEGAHVKALARRPEQADYIRDVPGVELVQGDVTDAARMHEVSAGCKYVFHVAVSYGNWQQQEAVNVTGTRHVAEAAAANGVERLVHVSSIVAYGYTRTGNFTEADRVTPTPFEQYGVTKVEGETVLREVTAAKNLDFSIVRPGMIYGPRSGQWTDAIFKHARRKPLIWIGDGSGSIFPIFIDDLVDLMVVVATHPAAHNETFNCVYPASVTWAEYLTAYAALSGNQNPNWLKLPQGAVMALARLIGVLAPSSSRLKAAPEGLNALLRQASIDMTKAQQLLGWQPQVDLAEGVQRCVPYLREQGLLP